MKQVLEFDSILLEYGNKVILNDIYGKVETGQTIGILGRNGAGKSSLLKIIFGTLNPYSKSVRINGTNILASNIKKQFIQYLTQRNMIPQQLSFDEVCSLYQISADDCIQYFNFHPSIKKKSVEQLSGGEVRMLAIFCILKCKGMFALLDEPFSYLSPLNIEKIKALINQEKVHKGIIITDHLYREVNEVSESLYCLSNACLHRLSNPDDLVKWGYLPI